jgi:hypothetical protein
LDRHEPKFNSLNNSWCRPRLKTKLHQYLSNSFKDKNFTQEERYAFLIVRSFHLLCALSVPLQQAAAENQSRRLLSISSRCQSVCTQNGLHIQSPLSGKFPVRDIEVISFRVRSFVNLSSIKEEAPLLQSILSPASEYVNYRCQGL